MCTEVGQEEEEQEQEKEGQEKAQRQGQEKGLSQGQEQEDGAQEQTKEVGQVAALAGGEVTGIVRTRGRVRDRLTLSTGRSRVRVTRPGQCCNTPGPGSRPSSRSGRMRTGPPHRRGTQASDVHRFGSCSGEEVSRAASNGASTQARSAGRSSLDRRVCRLRTGSGVDARLDQ